jgi:hypothetical protein
MDAILRRHLSQPGFSLNGHLRGVVDEGETEIVSVDIFYSFDDQEDMKPQFAGTTQPGSFLDVAIDLHKRPIRFFARGTTATGLKHARDLKEATQTVYTPTPLDLSVATSVGSLFNFTFIGTTQAAGSGTIANDGTNFYTYLMPAGTLAEGDAIFAEFAFELLNNGNQKDHELRVFGIGLGTIATTKEGSGWMRVTFQLQAGGTVKYNTIAIVQDLGGLTNEVVLNETGEITGLDFDTLDYVWEYIITDLNAPGDSSVIMGNAFRIPVPAEALETYLTSESGDFLVSEDGPALISE